MELSADTLDNLSVAIKSCDIFLTPNTRLAKRLSDVIVEQCAANRPGAVFSIPSVFSFDQWFNGVYAEAMLRGLCRQKALLSVQQERALWAQVISEQEKDNPLVLSSAVSSAQKAYGALADAQLSAESEAAIFDSLPDSRRFLNWYRAFRKVCGERDLITLVDAKQEILGVNHREIAKHANSRFALVGFEKLTALQQALVMHFSRTSASAFSFGLEAVQHSLSIQSFDSEEQELIAAYEWAKRLRSSYPEKKIAVVVKDLQQRRLQAQRLAREVFYPSQHGNLAGLASDPFNLSMGYSLGSSDIMSCQRLLINTFFRRVHLDEWLILINSPYTHWGRSQRWFGQLLLRAMYASGEREFRFDEIGSLVDWYLQKQSLAKSERLTALLAEHAERVVSLRQLIRLESVPRQPSFWLSEIMCQVYGCGWPGLDTLSSGEYQQFQTALEAIETFAYFDNVLGALSLEQSCQEWFRLLNGLVFQAQTLESEDSEPVQILGLLEASGQSFDALWVTGLSEVQWPQTVSPNPFIPLQLQIQHGMPSASYDQERDYSESITRSLLGAANSVIVSYPHRADEVSIGLSPLVSKLIPSNTVIDGDSASCSRLETSAQRSDAESTPVSFELLTDTRGKPYTVFAENSDDVPVIPKGMAIISDVLNNPLQAYLKHRLNADILWPAQSGVQFFERGNVAHRVLERIWSEAKHSEVLKQQSSVALAEIVKSAVTKCLNEQLTLRYRTLPDYLVSTEIDVISGIVQAWLVLDLSMPDVEILGLEVPIALPLETSEGVFSIRGRIDRLERRHSEEGSFDLIADYKTGSPELPGWLNEPLQSPQIPAYALALADLSEAQSRECFGQTIQLDGLYLAQLRPGNIRVNGFAWQQPLVDRMPGVKAALDFGAWPELTQSWRRQLEQAASQFLQGDASFDGERHESHPALVAFTRSTYTV